jgi:hypothetical protein
MRRILGRNATQGRARENVSQAGETKTGPSALSLRAGDQTVVMKLASLLFFALLIYVHQVCSPFEALDWPLSAFREGECEPLGYALFGAIALVTGVYSVDLRRFRDPIEAIDTIGFGVLLLFVALSPNRWMFHRVSAFTLLGCTYVFFAIHLRQNLPLMLIHLTAPIVLAVVTGFESYGIWQKALISYFVVVGTIHHHVATRAMRGDTAGAVEAA